MYNKVQFKNFNFVQPKIIRNSQEIFITHDSILYFAWLFQPQFLVALAVELATTTRSQVCRMAAALQLKNQLTSKDDNVKLAYQQRWLALEEGVRQEVKAKVSIVNFFWGQVLGHRQHFKL